MESKINSYLFSFLRRSLSWTLVKESKGEKNSFPPILLRPFYSLKSIRSFRIIFAPSHFFRNPFICRARRPDLLWGEITPASIGIVIADDKGFRIFSVLSAIFPQSIYLSGSEARPPMGSDYHCKKRKAKSKKRMANSQHPNSFLYVQVDLKILLKKLKDALLHFEATRVWDVPQLCL